LKLAVGTFADVFQTISGTGVDGDSEFAFDVFYGEGNRRDG
jgi:hypothetical protein